MFNPIPLVTDKDENVDTRINIYRAKSNMVILYTKYNNLHDLDNDYENYLQQDEENRVISDIVSIDLTNKNNIERYKNMRKNFLKNYDGIFDPIKGYIRHHDLDSFSEAEESKVKSNKNAHEEYWGFTETKLKKYRINYSNIIAGMFVRLESLVELLYFDYHQIDVIQNALAPVNKDDAKKIIFSNYHDPETEKEREFFKDKVLGIVCYDSKNGKGYCYCQETDRFYAFEKERPPIDHTKGMLYGHMLRKEANARNIPFLHTSEILSETSKFEAFYDYAVNGSLITEQRVVSYLIDKYPNHLITGILKTDVFDREKDGDKISVDRDIPYFTPQQMYDLGVSYHSKTPLYSPTPDCISINEKDIKKWYEEYKLKLEGYNSPEFTPGYEWRNTLAKLYKDIDELEGQSLLNRKQSILDLGWNPEIPFSDKARKFSRNKIEDYLKTRFSANVKSYEESSISMNESGENGTISIIFYEEYRNGYKKSAISFNEANNELFNFEGKRIYDKIEKKRIYVCCLPQSIINKIFNALKNNTIDNNPVKVYPNNMYIYDSRRVAEDKFRCMLKMVNTNPVELNISSIKNPKYVTEGTQITSLIPVTEVKEFPVDFDKDGNMLIKKGKKLDYEAEYAATHLAMKQYHKAKNVEGMEYCMCKLWYLNLMITEEIQKTKNKEKRIKLHKARAKIVNDIHTYMPYILELDPDFNIEEAYEQSPFSDHTVKINKSVIDAALALLKGLIKLVI